MGAPIDRVDGIGKRVDRFGVGVGVLTAISTGLSLAGSIGLTVPSLTATNATFLIALCIILYLRNRREKRQTDGTQYRAVKA